jgi:hypothetical protein
MKPSRWTGQLGPCMLRNVVDMWTVTGNSNLFFSETVIVCYSCDCFICVACMPDQCHAWSLAYLITVMPDHWHTWSLTCLITGMSNHWHTWSLARLTTCMPDQSCLITVIPDHCHVWSLACLITCTTLVCLEYHWQVWWEEKKEMHNRGRTAPIQTVNSNHNAPSTYEPTWVWEPFL